MSWIDDKLQQNDKGDPRGTEKNNMLKFAGLVKIKNNPVARCNYSSVESYLNVYDKSFGLGRCKYLTHRSPEIQEHHNVHGKHQYKSVSDVFLVKFKIGIIIDNDGK